MQGFDLAVLILLALIAIMAVAMLILLLRRNAASGWHDQFEQVGTRIDGIIPKIDRVDTRIGDNITIVELRLKTLQEESGSASRELRQEVLGAFEKLANSVVARVTEQADAQARRLDGFASQLADHRNASDAGAKTLRDELSAALLNLGSNVARTMDELGEKQGVALQTATRTIKDLGEANERRQEILRATIQELGVKQGSALDGATKTIKDLGDANERRQETLRTTVEGRLDKLRTENAEKLDQMRVTVDEKLQGTLNERLGASFSLVNENLERVFKSVGEMQALATGVGDLKRVLSNVKVRGSWGEGSLGALLEQMLTPEQYGQNVEVKPRSNQRVEYALKIPGQAEETLWVSIDSKMPKEDFERLMLASEQGDATGVEDSAKALEKRVVQHAKEICSKYICPPHTADYAVLFLPTEGLFAEVVRRPGLVDQLQTQFRVSVAGPTTLMAYLSMIRMGFRSMAIQQRSSEVWQVLSGVKTEFGKFGPVLEKVQKKLGEAQNAIEDANTRRRAMDKKLRDVETLPEVDRSALLALPPEAVSEPEVDEAAE